MITNASEAYTANIQIVDDNPQNLDVLAAVLTKKGYEVRTAISGTMALKSVQERLPDLILLDIKMPGMAGYQVCEQLKAGARTRDVPVIFISALDQVLNKVKAFSVGGVDYITKPFQEQEVLARVETHLALRNAQKSLEETNVQLQWANGELAHTNNELTHANDALAHEIAERMQAEKIKRELMHALDERVKELNCLYGISKLVETPDISLEEIVEGTVDLIPPAWQYPEITCARIILEGQEFSTENFAPNPWQQATDILVHGEQNGTVQVGYLHERPQSDEGPFLKEEGNLINAIAERLGKVTERMRTEQQVREQRQFLQNVLDSLPHPFYVINAETHIVEMANAAVHTGRLRGDITCYALTHGNDQPCKGTEHPCPLREVKRVKKPIVVEHVHLDRDDRRKDVEVHGFPIFDREGNVIQMIEYSLDITERKQIEAQRQQLTALEERERIGRELHDDLGQVMSYVNIQTQAALTRLEQGETAQVETILSRMTQVTQQAHSDVRQYILGIREVRIPGVRATAAQPPPDFFAALEGYLDTIRERYGLETQVSWPEDVLESPLAPEVETQLLRIIQEALTNVHRHAGVDAARMLFTFHADEVQVVIEDDGCGFGPLPVLPPQGEGEREGGHFGLSIMRERAESVGGGLALRSAPDQGTRVIVRLPLVLSPTLAPSPTGGGLGRGVRVLLVDDHPLYLEGLRGLLASRGLHVVGQAHDGLEALEQARALHPDLILMDVQMPHCDGVEATKRIKAELPEIKIVMLTMAAEGDILFEALKSGASGYLLKSLDGTKFFSLLADVMEGETVLSPALANQVLAEFTRKPDVETKNTSTLTPRQHEVLELVAQGATNQEIASALHVSEATVKYHVSQILERLHLQSRYQLAQYT